MFGGMISGTVLAVIFVRVFYLIITRFMHRAEVQAHSAATAITQDSSLRGCPLPSSTRQKRTVRSSAPKRK